MPSSAEINIIRFSKTNLARDFVLAHNGAWDHQAWLDFCAEIEDKGFTPINLNDVGLILEQKKSEYWRNGGKLD